MFINVHTGTNIGSLVVSLHGPDQNFVHNLTNPISLTEVEYIAQRNIYSAYFDQLSPSTNYEVRLSNGQTGQLLNATNYRTLPDEDGEEIRMAVGGDVGINDNAMKLTGNLMEYDPHVLIIGGDLAYDNGER